MKIGVIVDNDLNADIRVLREIRILKNHHHVSVLCFGFSGKKYPAPVEGIAITRIKIKRRLKDILFFFLNLIPVYEWLWAFKIKDFIIANKIEHLHVHDLYMARAARKGITRSGRRIQMTLDLHENYSYAVRTYNWTRGFPRKILARPDVWKKKEHKYLKYADTIIVLSSEFRDEILSGYQDLRKKKFVVFPNVPDLTQPEYNNIKEVENPFRNDFPVLLYYGVIALRRGIFDTLVVFNDLVKNNYNVNLLLIGPVDRKDLEQFNTLAENLKSTGRFIHIPWIDSSAFPGYLTISDVCLAPFHKNPQHESGVANKIYDYMLGGKPVVVSDCKPQALLVKKYECGIVFSNHEEFKQSIIKLMDDQFLREQMGKNGRNAILKDFHVAVFKDDLLRIYS